jgi:hypothetical protein
MNDETERNEAVVAYLKILHCISLEVLRKTVGNLNQDNGWSVGIRTKLLPYRICGSHSCAYELTTPRSFGAYRLYEGSKSWFLA